MIDEHWFDALNKSLVRSTSRQVMLRAAAATVTSHALGAAVSKAAKQRKKNKHRRKKKDKKKDKGKNKRNQPPCSGGACDAVPQWAGNAEEIDYCELICLQCDEGGPREFCIAMGRNGDPVAKCCDIAEFCCDPGAGRLHVCLDFGLECCPDDPERGYCLTSSHQCCPGFGCVIEADLENGQCPCPYGLTRCGRACRNTDVDEENCGGCNQTCVGPDLQCCDGGCVNMRTDSEHCGACYRGEAGLSCCGGREVYDSDLQFCCPDELRACFNNQLCCTRNDGTPACCPRP